VVYNSSMCTLPDNPGPKKYQGR